MRGELQILETYSDERRVRILDNGAGFLYGAPSFVSLTGTQREKAWKFVEGRFERAERYERARAAAREGA
jgi:hypothetical protein